MTPLFFNRNVLVCLTFLLVHILSTEAQTTVASDNCEAYSDNNYTDENQGSGFSSAFQFKNFGGNDQGGEYIETGSRKITGSQSFGLYANNTGTGKAISRPFSTALSGLHRVSFRIRFDLNTNASKTAGFVICSTATGDQTNWNTGQRLFMGISGDGLWKYDDGTLKTVTASGGGNFSCTGGDIYLVELDFNATSLNEYGFRITNESTSTTSAVITGTLGGSANSSIASFGFANGVTGSSQNVILDDLAAIQNPSMPLLPVELTEFAARTMDNSIQLTWFTASQSDNSHFEVQRSDHTRNWHTIGTVPGHGTTYQPQAYNFIDQQPLHGINYYRLKQVDFSGRYEYSKIVPVVFDGVIPVKISPNPASSFLFIEIEKAELGNLTVSIHDLLGRLLKKTNLDTEAQPMRLSLDNLPPGLLLLRLSNSSGERVLQQRFVKN